MFLNQDDDESSDSRLITSLVKSILDSKKYSSSLVLLSSLTDQYGFSESSMRIIISRLEEMARCSSSEFDFNVTELLRTRPGLTVESLLELILSTNNTASTLIERLNFIIKSSSKSKSIISKNVQIFSISRRHRLAKSNVK